jgi:hypothetical protein
MVSMGSFLHGNGGPKLGNYRGEGGEVSRDFSDFSGNIMEVLINLFSKQLEMNGEYDGDLVI